MQLSEKGTMKQCEKVQLENKELAEYMISETKDSVSRRKKWEPMTDTSERSSKVRAQRSTQQPLEYSNNLACKFYPIYLGLAGKR